MRNNNNNSDELELDREDQNHMKSLHFGDDRETSRSINDRSNLTMCVFQK